MFIFDEDNLVDPRAFWNSLRGTHQEQAWDQQQRRQKYSTKD
jgi:hypothetical protein